MNNDNEKKNVSFVWTVSRVFNILVDVFLQKFHGFRQQWEKSGNQIVVFWPGLEKFLNPGIERSSGNLHHIPVVSERST